MKFIDLFSGIGGFNIALRSRGMTCVGFSEISSTAVRVYCQNGLGGENENLGDITKIDKLPEHDILTAGVPCQSWSIAGKNLGFDDKRGLLWNDTIRLLAQSQPKAFIFENVKGLADPRNKASLQYILDEIKAAGYYAKPYLINAADYGLMQNRVRLYIVGTKKEFELNIKKPSKIELKCFELNDLRGGEKTIHSWDIFDTTDRQKEICLLIMKNRRKKKFGPKDGNPLSVEQLQALDSTIQGWELEELVSMGILVPGYKFKNGKISSGFDGVNRVIMPDSVFPTLTASGSNDFLANELVYTKKEFIEKIYHPKNYRTITKEEALSLQGFPTDFILPEKRSQWMKLIGNSLAVPVVDMLIGKILKL